MSAQTILVVDDMLTVRQPARLLLESAGYIVEEASNGQEALRKTAALRPDLVLLDLLMPEMNGLEVLKRIRADKRLIDMPIIVLTAVVGKSSLIEIHQMEKVEYLLKPFTSATLLDRVRRILGNGTSPS
jgi:CheY-like chemotaxis protein